MAFPCVHISVLIKPTRQRWQWENSLQVIFKIVCWQRKGWFLCRNNKNKKSSGYEQLFWEDEFIAWGWDLQKGFYLREHRNKIHRWGSLRGIEVVLDDGKETAHKTIACLGAERKETSVGTHPREGINIWWTSNIILQLFLITIPPGKIQIYFPFQYIFSY